VLQQEEETPKLATLHEPTHWCALSQVLEQEKETEEKEEDVSSPKL